MAAPDAKTVSVHMRGAHVCEVTINRPHKRNALDMTAWHELGAAFFRLRRAVTGRLDGDVEKRLGDSAGDLAGTRCVVLTGAGDVFCAGIDVAAFMPVVGDAAAAAADPARATIRTAAVVQELQDAFTAIAELPIPVVAAVHGACIGGGIDLIAGADIRLAAAGTKFSVKEIDLALAADVGTLQRLPRLVNNQSVLREWIYTGRLFDADEARACGLVSQVFPDADALRKGALTLAKQIATKSPVALYGVKETLLYATRDADRRSLRTQAALNGALLQAVDVQAAAQAAFGKKGKPATFANL